MYPQQPPNQPGGWHPQGPGQPVAPRSGGFPPFPVAIAVLAVVGFIGMFVGAGSLFGSTSTDELCDSYNALERAFNDDYTYSVATEVEDLIDAAENYDDEDVQSDAESLSNMGPTVTRSELTYATIAIRAECN